MKLNRMQLRKLIMETAFQNEDSSSKLNATAKALNALRDAALTGEFKINAQEIGKNLDIPALKNLKNVDIKLKLNSEAGKDEGGNLTFKIDPKIITKFKLPAELGDIKIEAGTDATQINSRFAKNINLPGLKGKVGIGINVSGNYDEIASGKLDKAFEFKGANINFSGKF